MSNNEVWYLLKDYQYGLSAMTANEYKRSGSGNKILLTGNETTINGLMSTMNIQATDWGDPVFDQ